MNSMTPDFRNLFESVPGLYLVLSPDFKIVAASNAYLKATLTKRKAIIGCNIFEVFPDNPDDPGATGVANLRASLNRVIKSKLPDAMAVQKYDIPIPDNGFEERYWSPLNSPVLGANKEVEYIIHRVEDVTEFMKLKQRGKQEYEQTEELKIRAEKMRMEIINRSQALQKANQKLREAEQIKNEFFANVSHELRTPLSLIIAPLESMLSGNQYGNVSESQAQFLQTVHNNAIRLLQMVNGLLDFAKFEAGRMKAETEATDVSALIRSVVSDFEPILKAKKMEITTEIDLPGTYFMVDRYLTERILFNLISNAVKFTPSGGKVSVRIKTSDGKLFLSVEDTGIGIEKSEIANLFRKFHQVEGSSTRRYEGTGLGLAMVKEFAGLLGGSVNVTSSIGRGSTFTVEFPASSTGAVPETAHFTMPHSSLTPQYQISYLKEEGHEAEEEEHRLLKLLICEDNEELTVYIVSLLRDMCRIKTARNGEEGLNLVQSWKPDMVLSDVMMPKKDGLELCKIIKSNPETSQIIVVLLTALTHRAAMLKGWEAKADEYLFKPFHPNELVTRIRTLLAVVAERKKVSAALAEKNDELARSHSELESFSHSVSKDLRTPLRTISNYTKSILQEYRAQLDETTVNKLNEMKDHTQHMGKLIDNLLAFSEIAHAKLKIQSVNMSEVVDEVIGDLKFRDKKTKPMIKIHNLSPADGDPELLKQVWTNLISNAVKYSSKKKSPVIEIGMKEVDTQPVYFVKDNGTGFDMQKADKLFEMFQRLPNASEFEGSGVKLALVHRIITKHGGKIWAEAKENFGATFYFTLPPTPQSENNSKEKRQA